MVVSVPAAPNRYYVLQWFDHHTHNFAYIGARATGTDAGDYHPDAAPVLPRNSEVDRRVGQIYRGEENPRARLCRSHALGQDLHRAGTCERGLLNHEAYKSLTPAQKQWQGIPDARKWPIIADSAAPDAISYMNRHGFPRMVGAKKDAGSVEEGIEFLQSFDIVVHPDFSLATPLGRLRHCRSDRGETAFG
jgi:Protein of unknown function (DUF1254)